MNKIYRHGDVAITSIKELPEVKFNQVKEAILALGKTTGHRHRVIPRERTILEIAEIGEAKFIRITGGMADLVHEEHKTIELGEGIYKVGKEQEYDPFMEEINIVID